MTALLRALATSATASARDKGRRMALAAGLMLAALLTGFAGLGFVLGAAYGALSLVMAPALAALVIGLVLLVAAAGMVAAASRSGQRKGGPTATPDPAANPAGGSAFSPENLAPTAAFVTSFVLARHLSRRK